MKSGSVERNSPQLRSVVEDFFGEVEELTPDSGMASTGTCALKIEKKRKKTDDKMLIIDNYGENILLVMNGSNNDLLSLSDTNNYYLRVVKPNGHKRALHTVRFIIQQETISSSVLAILDNEDFYFGLCLISVCTRRSRMRNTWALIIGSAMHTWDFLRAMQTWTDSFGLLDVRDVCQWFFRAMSVHVFWYGGIL